MTESNNNENNDKLENEKNDTTNVDAGKPEEPTKEKKNTFTSGMGGVVLVSAIVGAGVALVVSSLFSALVVPSLVENEKGPKYEHSEKYDKGERGERDIYKGPQGRPFDRPQGEGYDNGPRSGPGMEDGSQSSRVEQFKEKMEDSLNSLKENMPTPRPDMQTPNPYRDNSNPLQGNEEAEKQLSETIQKLLQQLQQ